MPETLIGWIVLGFLAGWLSGTVVPGRSARGCLPNIVVGVLGGILGGAIARELGYGQVESFLAATLVAVIGAVIVRLVIEGLSPAERR